jgi:hypothetical protein
MKPQGSIQTAEKQSSKQTIPTTEQGGGNPARKAGTPPTAKIEKEIHVMNSSRQRAVRARPRSSGAADKVRSHP